jgi:hypothetical protein
MSLSPLSSAYYDRALALLATAREKNAATIAQLAPSSAPSSPAAT